MQGEIKRTDNKFLFIVNGTTGYWGTMTTKWFKRIKYLYDFKGELISESIFKFRLPFKITHTIKFTETNQTVTLKFKSIFNPSFVCKYDDDLYEIIPHKGLKASIFKNGKQIGYYTDKQIEYLGGQTLYFVANDDVCQNLIFSFILAIKCDFNNDYSTMSVDIGNFGPEVRKFDSSWRPNTF